ncbi:MAG: PilZ domain-containing protein [Bdellovibrionales bacterium]|nr:PilZ domain-containing protein [Bdellovibrionales bacterium]
MSQKRRVPRRKVDQKVGVLVGGEYSVTRAFEMGEGGLKISYDGPLEIGQRIVVTFNVIGITKAIATAIVRYHSDKAAAPVYYGLEFLNLDFKIKRLIRNFVASWSENDPQENGFSSWEDRKAG